MKATKDIPADLKLNPSSSDFRGKPQWPTLIDSLEATGLPECPEGRNTENTDVRGILGVD